MPTRPPNNVYDVGSNPPMRREEHDELPLSRLAKNRRRTVVVDSGIEQVGGIIPVKTNEVESIARKPLDSGLSPRHQPLANMMAKDHLATILFDFPVRYPCNRRCSVVIHVRLKWHVTTIARNWRDNNSKPRSDGVHKCWTTKDADSDGLGADNLAEGKMIIKAKIGKRNPPLSPCGHVVHIQSNDRLACSHHGTSEHILGRHFTLLFEESFVHAIVWDAHHLPIHDRMLNTI
mmetsp:Transcript_96295/g.257536  ORF Transcript_96295/g.257536 Transcript_96295/m.257536 type:complete len:233 (-) Transcript_96295:776-1474(-)